jgi:transposase
MKIATNSLPKSHEALQKMLASLQQSLQQVQTELHSSKAELAAYKEKYIRLIEEIRLSRQHRFAPSSEKNLVQPSLFDEAGTELPEEVVAQLNEEIEIKSHARKKHPVRRPLPDYLPREDIIYDVPDAEKVCACGTALNKIGEEVSEQLKYIPEQVSVIRHVRLKYACKPCQGHVRVASMPVLLLPKSIASTELVAHTIVAKYVDHVPLYRQESIWQRLEIDLPRSSLCGWVIKTAELCEPLVKLLQTNLIQHDYVQADETTVQVLEEVGRNNSTKSYMWAYRGGDLNHPSIVLDYQETRAGFHAQTFLEGFNGYLQTDAYSGYHWTEKIAEITPVGCMAHARRPFAELMKLSKSTLAKEALVFFKKLYEVEREARENNLTHQQRHELRNSKAPAILNAFKQWLEFNLAKVPEQHKIGQAIQYALRHWVELTNYLKDGKVEIDNNLIENTIRPFTLGRKNWLFMGSPRGAKAGAALYSLIETCRANKVEPYKYFCKMLSQLRLCKTNADYQQLLPQHILL